MSKSYFRVRLSQVPAASEDIIITFCFDHGASGVTEALKFSQPDLTYDPYIIDKKFHEMDVFFTENPSTDFFLGLNVSFPTVHSSVFEEEEKDWLEEWKKGFQSFKLVGKFWIVPSWLPQPSECEQPIFIDPGMAFGTGTHATTQMMAHFIHRLAKESPDQFKDWTMMDVGTGTAILAMLARKLGFGLVEGIEIDPEARRVAKENVKNNKLNEVLIRDSLLEEIKGQYDVVVANIIDGVLIQIQKDLFKICSPEGYLLVTGILKERDNHFFEKFIENNPVKVIRRLEKDEWVGYWLQMKPNSQ